MQPVRITVHVKKVKLKRQPVCKLSDLGLTFKHFLVCARLRHVASKAWGTRRNMSMTHLDEMLKEEAGSAIS